MRRALILAGLLYGVSAAHADWSKGVASDPYEDNEPSPLSDGVIGLVAAGFAVYGFYKFATRND